MTYDILLAIKKNGLLYDELITDLKLNETFIIEAVK